MMKLYFDYDGMTLESHIEVDTNDKQLFSKICGEIRERWNTAVDIHLHKIIDNIDNPTSPDIPKIQIIALKTFRNAGISARLIGGLEESTLIDELPLNNTIHPRRIDYKLIMR